MSAIPEGISESPHPADQIFGSETSAGSTANTASGPGASDSQDRPTPDRRQRAVYTALELLAIVGWAMFLGRDYLDLNPNIWPQGREFGMAIQTHYIWTQLADCGSCILWNGSINGGAPAFAELHGAVLHPLVIIPTLIFGSVNGAKIGLVGALAMAGLAQWWLAKVMKLGLVARLWAAMMAVAGGHLAGRMDMGVVAIVLSTAAASLVIAAGLDLALTGRRRSAVLLGITLALAIVSGQGYLQIGLLFGILPAFIILIFDKQFHLKKVWREFVLAGGIALLLAGVFLVPLLHFWPNIGKELDAAFNGAQTIGNTLLNLVINDLSIYHRETLGTVPYPYQYVIFVGWIPVILALLSLRLAPKRQTRLLLFFIVSIFLVLLTASAVILGWFVNLNVELAASVRIPSLIAGLTVPLVLALAAWSVELLLHLDWPLTLSTPTRNSEGQGRPPAVTVPLSWLVIALLLSLSLYTSYTFSKDWLRVHEIDPGTLEVVDEAVILSSGKTQWIHFPFGEHFWAPLALEQGLKMTGVVRPWHWKDREPPAPRLSINMEVANADTPGHLGTIRGLDFAENPDQPYAFVQTKSDIIPCTTQARGGHVDVTCSTFSAGTLIVQENNLSGWAARRDGQRVPMDPSFWLNTEAPAGSHDYSFRYQPWDVPVGLILSLIGIAICIWIWFFRSKPE